MSGNVNKRGPIEEIYRYSPLLSYRTMVIPIAKKKKAAKTALFVDE